MQWRLQGKPQQQLLQCYKKKKIKYDFSKGLQPGASSLRSGSCWQRVCRATNSQAAQPCLPQLCKWKSEIDKV